MDSQVSATSDQRQQGTSCSRIRAMAIDKGIIPSIPRGLSQLHLTRTGVLQECIALHPVSRQ